MLDLVKFRYDTWDDPHAKKNRDSQARVQEQGYHIIRERATTVRGSIAYKLIADRQLPDPTPTPIEPQSYQPDKDCQPCPADNSNQRGVTSDISSTKESAPTIFMSHPRTVTPCIPPKHLGWG